MLKIITKSMFFLLALSLMIAINQVALATEEYVFNGQEVNYAGLENKVKGILGWALGGFLVIFALVICSTVFWIMMIVHAAKHEVENKAMWIILIVFTGIIGALIYYFVVKRKFSKQFSPPMSTITK